ncbi:RagB/SusD family nutrient uptake outer membrane protein [Pedobacter polaris]|uniref:RagB/SusD family nutrient uptake outer membrane protein n=1 Tax=Pedobacter polaris TaxID=2571273 RepID=A0A4U1CKY0_9SPHI|nr:RagB/SusD family nutrient uptake outer membrane protein [Pedobacter polaris]TKC05714.1 RagB/SusD family nutrient uptake outer membrane protein [Pedobacter polaris]
MKIKYLIAVAVVSLLITGNTACKKTFNPSTAIDENSALTSEADIETATIGTYALFKAEAYVRSGYFFTEYPTDEVAQGQNSSDDLSNIYKYTPIKTSSHAANFWSSAYKSISAANRVIEAIDDNASLPLRQLKGENLYIRAMLHFNLVRIFARPYSQNPTVNLGVPILKEGLTDDEKLTLARSNVNTVYDFIVADLLKASTLMNQPKSNSFASKEVAYALLSRVYLYMEKNAESIEYADKVINSGRYNLLSSGEYPTYFRGAPDGNKETIFCIRHIKTEDRGFSAIGSMYFSGDASGNALNQAASGWGEIYASKKLYDALNVNPQDLRLKFISPLTENGVVKLNNKITPNAPMYYINKYSLQEGIVNLSSPVYLRLAEMYLNKAEANAKISGKEQLALDDVNKIRTRAGIPILTLAGLATSGKSVLDAVLEERWFELSFEGHRAYDLFRNNRPLIRNYPGTGTSTNQIVQPGDSKIIAFIPQNEVDKNNKLIQNP